MIRSMIILAEAKGWFDIKVKGSEDFKREAWMEAAARRGTRNTQWRKALA
ncbi:MAG: hypothetical protein LBI87_02010 [Candidatus Accumulibacter sp.]|jgi:hypothetical protein|nr:hypothetical protein [Accumulibacter sp.]